MKKEASEIKLNTHNEVDQILGNPPSWILRWGLTLVLLATIIFGLIAWLIKYPDVIYTPINIVTENPAIEVVARSSGKISQLLVNNNETVTVGETIAVLENTAALEDVEKLNTFLEKAAKKPSIKPIENLTLGSLQSTYAALSQKLNDYRFFLQRQGDVQKINSLESQIAHIQKLSDNLKKQKNTLVQEVNLSRKDFERNEKLFQKKIASEIEVEKSETAYLQYNRQLEILENKVVNNDISIEQLRTQIIDLQQNKIDGQSQKHLDIQQDIEQLKSEINLWKQNYLITAPIAGKASFSKIWGEQQFIAATEKILTIVPTEGAGKIIGKAKLPLTNSGKVQIGQTANIRLYGFPYMEYGIIKATVNHISLVPVLENNHYYLLDIKLPDSLVTTYDKVIPFRQEMQGTAIIITEDRRVLERIFDRMNSILKNT